MVTATALRREDKPIAKNNASAQNTRTASNCHNTGWPANCSDIRMRDCPANPAYVVAFASAAFCASVFWFQCGEKGVQSLHGSYGSGDREQARVAQWPQIRS